jgi:hypothetical protein
MERVKCGVVYGLYDPSTGELRYIGQTITHWKASRWDNKEAA